MINPRGRTSVLKACFTVALVALTVAGCGSDDSSGGGGGGGGAKNAKIAFLMPDTASTRYELSDKPLFEKRLKEICSGCSVLYQNADSDAAKQQQQVPLMSANALEQQRNTMDPYADDDGDVEQKDAPIDFRMPPHGQIGSPVLEHVYPGQTAPIAGQTVDIPGALMRPERVIREDSVDYL